ncbi:MAG TPA: toll/interleukin-1 receptor domain-containing protein [Tahibacter sp.]|nr:toll/interleukin-1 receptor domain-containing protein [Tahibacter sp.]
MASRIFFSYAHEDEVYRDRLEKHLALLRRSGLVELWHDRRILAGQQFGQVIDEAIDRADIVLLLVSANFLASEYCYSVELSRALERHRRGEAVVIPVILSHCDRATAPFSDLLAAPRDGRPLTEWPNVDAGYADVAMAVRRVVEELTARSGDRAVRRLPDAGAAVPARTELQRSSNLRLRKEFSELDRHQFLIETFRYLQRFFDGSLEALRQRNTDIASELVCVDAYTFVATLYRGGRCVSECAVTLRWGDDAIVYSNSADSRGSNYNESVSVDADDQTLYLRALGLAQRNEIDISKLSQEGAAELYWAMFIAPLQ